MQVTIDIYITYFIRDLGGLPMKQICIEQSFFLREMYTEKSFHLITLQLNNLLTNRPSTTDKKY